MKKTKIFMTFLIVAVMISAICLNSKVLAEDLTPADMARDTGGNEEGIMPINEDGENDQNVTSDEHNHEDIEIHNGDLYVADAGREYVMDQNVDGNVFIFGNNVKITGSVNGSLFVFASKLTIEESAYIATHVFAFADTINMNGMAFDLYTGSRNLTMGDSAVIYRDLKAASESIYLTGAVGRDVNLYAGKITAPTEEQKLMIYGTLKYEAPNEIANLDKATIQGETIFNKSEETEKRETSDIILDYVFSAVGTIVFDVLMYIALLFLAPNFVKKTKEYVSTKGLLAFAIGLAFTVLVPIIAFLLLLTGIGAGISAFMILFYGAVLMLNAFIVTATVTEFIAGKINLSEDKFKKGLLLIPVSLVIWALRKIPFIGSWISIIVFLCGVGIITFYQFDKRRKAKEVKE